MGTCGHKMFFTFISNQYIRVLNRKTIDEQYKYSKNNWTNLISSTGSHLVMTEVRKCVKK